MATAVKLLYTLLSMKTRPATDGSGKEWHIPFSSDIPLDEAITQGVYGANCIKAEGQKDTEFVEAVQMLQKRLSAPTVLWKAKNRKNETVPSDPESASTAFVSVKSQWRTSIQ